MTTLPPPDPGLPDEPRRRRPLSGWLMPKLDMKAWAGIITAIIATGGVVWALMSGFFWTREEQSAHQIEFSSHVTEFKAHEAVVEERQKAQERMMDKIDAMYENQIRTGEKLRVRRLRRVEDEEESP